MSCPDWNGLTGRRSSDPTGWAEAVEHFDGCAACRDTAISAEPTLLFRRLPSPPVEADEVSSMKAAVAAMRRAESLTARPAEPRRFSRWSQGSTWARAAAVAAVLVGAVWLEGSQPGSPRGGEAALAEQAPAVTLDLSRMPRIENPGSAMQGVMTTSQSEVWVYMSEDLDV